jgi:hypothetical protein
MLENAERGKQKGTVQRQSKRDSPEAIKKGRSRGNQKGTVQRKSKRDGGNIGYTRRRQTKQKHDTISVEHHYTQAQIT